ncbi:MAG: type II secretion system F family protein [Oscillospiraceae bacterium]|nr:type II secretion system F family protein [Oscillospiraceae bacterium]
MIVFVMILATLMLLAWLVLLGRTTRDDWITAAHSKILENYDAIEKLQKCTGKANAAALVSRSLECFGIKFQLGKENKKQIEKIQNDIQKLQRGDLKSVGILIMPGFVLLREFEAVGKGAVHKTVLTYYYELHGKKYAEVKTKHLLAKLISYPIIGVALTLNLGALLVGLGSDTAGLAILGIGSVLVLVLAYAMYDELGDRVRKRRSAISKQFPNVVSKLALLVTSGMTMDRAWRETAASHDAQLYMEMRRTADELDNLVSPESAYGNFISRCNTKETAKLASAILQNLSKGNSEVGKLLKSMAQEAWQERRHMAKRDAEKANSKLMIPTMLLLLAILVMLMVPVAMNFSGL